MRNKSAFLALCFFLVLPHLFGVFADTDVFWHLKGGLDLLRSGTNPYPDPYTFSDQTHPWINHEWISEIIFAWLFTQCGFAGLIVLRFSVLFGISVLVGRALLSRVYSMNIFMVLLAFTVEILAFFFNIQPSLFSILLFLLVLVIAERSEETPALLYVYPFLFLFWANIHGSWILGIFALGLITGEKIFQRERPWRLCAAILLISVVVTAMNPYGFSLYTYIWHEITTHHAFNGFWLPLRGEAILIPVIFAIAPFIVSRFTGQRLSASLMVLVCVLCVATVKSQRILPYLILASFWALPVRGKDRAMESSTLATLLIIAFILIRGVLVAYSSFVTYGAELRIDKKMYPVGATQFLKEHFSKGNIALPFHWGGYVMWTLPETFKVNVDGRNIALYSQEAMDNNVFGYVGGDLERFLKGLSPDILLIQKQSPLFESVTKITNGEMQYEDNEAAVLIFRRKEGETP